MQTAFCDGAREMLNDKDLKCKWKQIEQIDAGWSKAQKDVIKAKILTSQQTSTETVSDFEWPPHEEKLVGI